MTVRGEPAGVGEQQASPPIVVVVVTYGDRAGFLVEVLDAVRAGPEVVGIVVVDNGSTADLPELVRGRGSGPPIRVVGSGCNEGSAAGFATGMRAAVEMNGDGYLLLLDDDNVPAPGAVAALSRRLGCAVDDRTAIMMNRPSRPEIRAYCDESRGIRHIPNTYCGFSVRGLVERVMGRWRERPSGHEPIGYAPYGGLAMPAHAVDDIGVPRADYFLYCDDHEFTTRMVRSGYTIHVAPEAVVVDAEESWRQSSRTFIAAADVGQSEQRVFYSTRNRRHFERGYLHTSTVEMCCNAVVYWAAVLVDSATQILTGRATSSDVWRRVCVLRLAIAHGNAGRLGRLELDGLDLRRASRRHRSRSTPR